MAENQRPVVVGLTGGIGSGKSTVASMLGGLGVPVLDLDTVGHLVTASGSKGLAALVNEFGEGILDGDTLNREKLAYICFASKEKTNRLNRLIHPLIWQQAGQWIGQQESPYVVIEASVLIESGGNDHVDRIVVVMANIQTRKNRVLARGNMNEEMFESIVARQCDDDTRLKHADDVIWNDSDIRALGVEVKVLHEKLLKEFY